MATAHQTPGETDHTTGLGRTAKLFRRLFAVVSELGLAVIISLAFFLIVMGALRLGFPKGTGLAELFNARFQDTTIERARPVFDARRSADETPLARLSYVHRRVLDRPGAAVLWNDSSTGMGIGNRHTVRTLKRSGAGLHFDDGSNLNLEQESLLVVRRFREGRSRKSSASFVLLDGDMHGSIAVPLAGAESHEIVTGSGTARIAPTSRSPARFVVHADENGASSFSVRSGALEVSAGGSSTIVAVNHFVTVQPDESFSDPVRLPDAPALEIPVDGATVTYGRIYPEVRFSWVPVLRAEAYELIVATDPDLNDVVYRHESAANAVAYGNFEHGQYYWRVTPLCGARGRPSVTRQLHIVRDETPPELAIEIREEVHAPEVVIAGSTEPGSRVTVGNDTVSVTASGHFEHRIQLARGPNLVVVEASDDAGNVSYHSQYVTATY